MKKFGKFLVLLSISIVMGVNASVVSAASPTELGQQGVTNSISIKGIDDVTIGIGSQFDTMKGVKLVSNSGKINPYAGVYASSNFVQMYNKGGILIKYAIFDGYGNWFFKTRKVTVTSMSNTKPELRVTSKIILKNSAFNPLDYVTAFDKEDGNISKNVIVDGNVNTSVSGMTMLTYTITDSAGNTVSKTASFYVL